MRPDLLFKLFTFFWVFVACHAIFVEYRQTQVVGYWKDRLETDRGRFPSSNEDFDQKAINLYRDFFSYDEFHKYLSFNISLHLEGTDDLTKEPHLSQIILDEALKESLMDQANQPLKEHGVERLQAGIKGLISQELLPTLAKTIAKKINEKLPEKVSKEPFQVNLNFKPMVHAQFSFNEEYRQSDALIWDDGKSLTRKLNAADRELHESIFHTAIPNRPGFYQYHGGQITLWYSPKEEEGFIRFRRYLRSPRLAKSRATINSQEFRVNIIHLNPVKETKKGAYDKGRFITSDIYQGFNEEKKKPWLEKSETYFGKLIPTFRYERSLATAGYPYREKVIETDQLDLHGVVKYEGREIMFKTHIEKLVYDFKNQKFTAHSKLKTSLNERNVASLEENHDSNVNLNETRGKIHQKIYHHLLHTHVIDLIKGLSLRDLYGGIKKGENDE